VTPNSADLSLTKQVNDPAPSANQNVVFSLTVNNNGPQTATNVAVADQLPAGLTFVSAVPSGVTTYSSGTGVWTIGSIASGATATLQITATVTAAGVKTNTAQISASDQFDVDSTPGNSVAAEDDQASATITPVTTDLQVTKQVDTPAPQLGTDVTFTITVLNNGTIGATGVLLNDLLPSGLTLVSSTPSGTTTYNSGTGVWTVGSLSAGASATLTVVATAGTPGSFDNTAAVSALNEFDTDSTNDQATATVSVIQDISPRLCVQLWHRT